VDVRELKIRPEAENLRYEPAVDLGDVARGQAPHFMQEPIEFFERTHLTDNMRSLIIKSLMNLTGLRETIVKGRRYNVVSNLILLPSDIGGGKTHALILLYHITNIIINSNNREEVVKELRILDEAVAEFVEKNWSNLKVNPIKVVVIDCKCSELAPSPAKPISIAAKEIKTLLGYLRYDLGRYDLLRYADENCTAPYADDLFRVLNESRALILIDEIGRYYDESKLSHHVISAFLMNLAETMSKYAVSKVSAVLSVPYEAGGREVEARPSMQYVHSPELIEAVNKVLSRPNVEILKPVERQDLANILKKRIFSHSKEELESLAEKFISKEVGKEYPNQVRKVLDDRGFWKSIRKTFPFHPCYLELLEKLAYKLHYLQRTRDALKITVHTVLALREGMLNHIEEKPALIMPYHIPIFINEALNETILRNAPKEYMVFRLILSSNVAEPKNYEELKKLSFQEFYSSVAARPLRDLKEEEAKLGLKLSAIIWLHSLIGLGLPMNMGDFPTTADLIYSVSPTDLDVKGTLGILRSILPQLIVHGDPDSDTARWFFTSIPSIDELVEVLKKNVTDEMAKERLAQFIEDGLEGKRGRGRPPRGYSKESIFTASKVVKSVNDIPSEVLDSRDPSLVIFVDIVHENKLRDLLKGRNNLIVLAPYITGYDQPQKLAAEDVKGIKELTSMKEATSWDGLIELLRYYEAIGSIDEKQLAALAGEKLAHREYEGTLLDDIINLLKKKVESKKQYYYRHVWNMINRCYTKAYYSRQGKLLHEDGLSLESDEPLAPIVERFLREKGLIPEEFNKDGILSIFSNYLGKDVKEDEIDVGNLWSFIRSTDKANVPLISWKMFLNAIKELIKTLDYAVIIKGKLFWKHVFENKEKADTEEEGEVFLQKISEYITELRSSWEDVKLVYWEKIFNKWLNETISRIPEDKVIKVKDRSGNVYDIRDIKIETEITIKTGRLFYEEKKYPVKIDIELPEETWEKREYPIRGSIAISNFDDEIYVKLTPSKGLYLEPTEFKGKSPLNISLKFRGEMAGNYEIKMEIFGGGKLLDTRILMLEVKGEWITEEVELITEGVPKDAKITCIEVYKDERVPDLIRIWKSYAGKLSGSVEILSKNGEVTLNLNLSDPKLLELIWSTVNNLKRLADNPPEVRLTYTPEGEVNVLDVSNKILAEDGFKFIIRRRIANEPD